MIEADVFMPPAVMPTRCAAELAGVAMAYLASLSVPATHDERTSILGDLRLRTIPRDEHQQEARARFRLLREAVGDVPADVLRDACDQYARNEKFFPTAVSELVRYTARIVAHRKRVAHRLGRLAQLAEEGEREAARIAADPLTPEIAARIKEEEGLNRDPVEVRPVARFTPARRLPTVEDYVGMGVPREEAEATVAILSRLGKAA